LHKEASGTGHGHRAIPFAEGVVEEAGQDVFFLFQATQALKKLFLRFTVDDEVRAGNQ